MDPRRVVDISPETFDGLGAGWEDLNRRLGGSFFQTPVWAESWWEGVGSPPGVLAHWGEDRHPDALVGLVTVRRRLHRRVPLAVRLWTPVGAGVGSADHVGWLADHDHDAKVAAWVGSTAGRRSIEVRACHGDERIHALRGGRVVAQARCPVLDLSGDRDRAVHDPKLAKKLRYYRRRLENEDIVVRVVEPGSVRSSVLDALYDLNASRHEAAGAVSVLHPEQRAIHEGVLRRSRPDCGAFAVVAERDDEVIGVLYGFWWGGTASYFNSGWTPAAASLSVGTVLIDEALVWARAQGAARFDFLRGPEDYKYRFGAVDHIDQTWLAPRGVSGLALRAIERARARRQPSVPDDEAVDGMRAVPTGR